MVILGQSTCFYSSTKKIPGLSVKQLALLVLLPLTLKSFAQSDSTDSTYLARFSQFGLRLHYNSSLVYPGAGIQAEIMLLPVKYKTRHERTISWQKLISAGPEFYHHPFFHDNLYFAAEFIYRRINDRGFMLEFSAGPGFSRTFLPSPTYSVDNNGNVSIVKDAGYWYALAKAGAGAGYDFYERKRAPFILYGKLDIIVMAPYNSTFYPRPVVEAGVIYHFKKR